MINFFRKTRKELFDDNQPDGRAGKTMKYMRYAVGEIALVVIGILIALQINNWNENKKNIIIENQLYENLLTSLEKDSEELVRIIDYQTKSVNQLNKVINSTAFEITSSMSEKSISEMLYELSNGAYSFFPKYGNYNSIVSSKGLEFIKSDSIKSKLIDLYDYQYKRYDAGDKIIDNRFQNILIPFLNEEIGFYVNSDFEPNTIDKNRFEKNYIKLQLQCKNLTGQLSGSLMLLQIIQKSVNTLIDDMESEKNK